MLQRAAGAGVRALALVALLVGCATSHKLEVATHEESHDKASGEREEGATLVLEFAPASPPLRSGPDGQSQSTPSGRAPVSLSGWQSQASKPDATDGLPPHGPLLKATFTGPINEAWRSSSDGLSGAEVHEEHHSAPASGCAFGLGFYGALVIAGLLAIGIAYLRLRP